MRPRAAVGRAGPKVLEVLASGQWYHQVLGDTVVGPVSCRRLSWCLERRAVEGTVLSEQPTLHGQGWKASGKRDA